MRNLENLEKKINSELNTKINKTEIKPEIPKLLFLKTSNKLQTFIK